MTDPVQPPALPDYAAAAGRWTALSAAERRSAAFALAGILGVFVVAAILTPDQRGVGTHQQLGLPPCMAEAVFGLPCPFCGMTTSFSHMAHGDIAEAITVQPAGALGFSLSAALAIGLLGAIITGVAPAQWKVVRHSPWLYAAAGTIIAVAWIYKIFAYTGVLGR